MLKSNAVSKERLAYVVAQMCEYIQEQRNNYKLEMMVQHMELNAQWKQEMRQHCVLHDSLDRRLIPEGRRCNIDGWDLTTVRYFNFEGLSACCWHYKAEDFSKEIT